MCTLANLLSLANYFRFPRLAIGGKPLDLLLRRGGRRSQFMTNLMVKTISWFYYGNLTRFGFPTPPKPSLARVSVNANFVETLSAGKVIYTGGGKLKKVASPYSVEFEDGTVLDNLDAIILATGYRPEFGFRTNPCIFLI
jgi:hypothetical protein